MSSGGGACGCEFRGLEAMLALAVERAGRNAGTRHRPIAYFNDLLKQWTTAPPPEDTAEAIHRAAMIERIQEFERDPLKFVPLVQNRSRLRRVCRSVTMKK